MVIWYDIFKINVQSLGKNLFVNVVITGIGKNRIRKLKNMFFFQINFSLLPPNVLEWEELENKYQ